MTKLSEDKTEQIAEVICNFLTVVEGAAFDAKRQIVSLYKIEENNEKPSASEVNIQGLDKLPWKSYRTKDFTTNPKEAGWIWANIQLAKELASQLEQHNGKIIVSGMEYSFSGPEANKKQFIARKPTK